MTNRAVLLSYGADSFWNNVTLLAFNDNAPNGTTTFLDQSSLNLTLTRNGNAVYTTTTPPPGMTSSADCHTITSGISIASNAAFAFGTGDYTIEFYVYFAVLAQSTVVVDFRPSIGSNPVVFFDNNGTNFWASWNNVNPTITGSLPAATTWTHYALVRIGTTNTLYLNGTATGSTATDSNNWGNSGVVLGNALNLSTPLNGLMGPVRVTKAARYTANFTRPTLPFPTHA